MNSKYKIKIVWVSGFYGAVLFKRKTFLFIPYWTVEQITSHELMPYNKIVIGWQQEYLIPDKDVEIDINHYK